MDITKDIPAQTGVLHRVENITFSLKDKMAYVNMEVYDSSGMDMKGVAVNVMTILATATDPQKAVICGFFKQVIAEATAIALASVPDEVFNV
jgi:hypothetical protein